MAGFNYRKVYLFETRFLSAYTIYFVTIYGKNKGFLKFFWKVPFIPKKYTFLKLPVEWPEGEGRGGMGKSAAVNWEMNQGAGPAGILRLSGDRERLESQLMILAEEIAAAMNEMDSADRKAVLGSFVGELFSLAAGQDYRESQRQRQAAGITAARARGAKFGRPPRPLPENFQASRRAWREGKLTLKDAAAACGLPAATFYDKAVLLEKSEDE